MSAPHIRKLPMDLVNKIAAGEVVERPASVVKELVENSLDAGAARITVALEDGGKRLIRVSDDGTGMSPADLALAFESHATSKLLKADDLFDIRTLGFRGEALASVASVSHCKAVSRERGASEGASIECDAGRMGAVRACGAPEGTLIEARDLFFNTPARLKFLRTSATELRHVVEMLTRLALPHPQVAFELTHNQKPLLRLEPAAGARERLAALFTPKLAESLLPVESRSSAMEIHGFISPPGAGETQSLQYVFLNGRYIRDRAIQRAIAEAYRSRMMRGKFPAVFLDLRLDPARVDVNVHPTKIEVRFRDSGAVFAQVLSALEKTLASAGSVAGISPAPAAAEREPVPESQRKENVRKAVIEFFERTAAGPQARDIALPRPVTLPGDVGAQHAAPSGVPTAQEAPSAPQPAGTMPPSETGAQHAAPLQSAQPPPGPQTPPARIGAFFQVHDTYIVEETPDGFLLIDQHALHERILYEELRRRVSQASVPRQRLMAPEVVELRAAEFLQVMEWREPLLKMGLEVEEFGERTVAIQAVPHMATGVDPRELLMQLLRDNEERAAGRTADREEQLLCSIACKAAIKAGERLSPARIQALLEQRNRLGPEPTCPHGRPTTLRFRTDEIEKQFHRK